MPLGNAALELGFVNFGRTRNAARAGTTWLHFAAKDQECMVLKKGCGVKGVEGEV